MMEYEVTIRPELIKHNGPRFDPIDEVQRWLRDNKVFGWHAAVVTNMVSPMKQQYYICFNNTTDAMLFTLRWS